MKDLNNIRFPDPGEFVGYVGGVDVAKDGSDASDVIVLRYVGSNRIVEHDEDVAVEILEAAVKRFTFRGLLAMVGATLAVYRYTREPLSDGTLFEVRFSLPTRDVATGMGTLVNFNLRMTAWEVIYHNSDDVLVSMIQRHIQWAMKHEGDESILVDGKPFVEPHPESKPR